MSRNFDGLEPRRFENIKGIVAPEIGPQSFGTFEKQAPDLYLPQIKNALFVVPEFNGLSWAGVRSHTLKEQQEQLTSLGGGKL